MNQITKTFFTSLIATIMLLSTIMGAMAQAVSDLEKTPKLLPGDALYPIKTSWEKAKLVFKFSDESTAEYRLTLANERLKEIRVLYSSDKTENNGFLAITKERYNEELNQAELVGAKISSLVKQKEFEQKLQVAMQYHLTVLEGVKEKVGSDNAKEAIQRIIERSKLTEENTKEVLKRNETSKRLSIATNQEGKIEIKKED